MQKITGGIIMLVVMFCVFNCGDDMSDYAGTYKVYDNRTPFNLVLNEDGSVRANMGGKGETYGSWEYHDYKGHENMCYIVMDNDFEFIFGFNSPVLDPNTNRLYFSLQAYESKNPNKYFNIKKAR